MTIREQLVSKVQRLPDDSLSEVFEFVQSIEAKTEQPSLMQRLRKIQIQGPRDFSENIDLYLSGEKKIEDNLD